MWFVPRLVLAILVLAASPGRASATNGLNLIGYGAASAGLAGAGDVALAADTSAINTNPAGLARIRVRTFEATGIVNYLHDAGFRDSLGNDRDVGNKVVPASAIGYAHPLGGTLVAGFGFFAQGGTGGVYRDARTPAGTNDRLASLLGIARIGPALAWRATDALSVGLSVGALVAQAEEDFFPGTSIAGPQPLLGYSLRDLQSVRPAVRAGAQYRASDTVTLGVVYGSRVSLPLSGGTMQLNLTSVGGGSVRYGRVDIVGLGLAQEVGAGASWEWTPRTTIVARVSWLDWSRSMREQRLTASDPDSAAAPATVTSVRTLGWRDQYVYAVGVAHSPRDRDTVYLGYNYGRNPVPNDALSPTVAPIGERHFTLGLAREITRKVRLAASLEYLRTKRVDFDNPALPFGQSSVRNGSLMGQFTLTYRL